MVLSQVKAGGAEGLVALGEIADAAPLLQQVRALGLQLKLIAQRDEKDLEAGEEGDESQEEGRFPLEGRDEDGAEDAERGEGKDMDD